MPAAERETYCREQRSAILAAFGRDKAAATTVFDVDFGHTDPQYVLPYGGRITVDGPTRRVIAH